MASTDSAFRSVERSKPCFLIWRIENMQVVPIPKQDYGKFFKGDSYIILSIKDTNRGLEANIHFWLGKETTQDEAGVAAYKSVELDDMLGGYPVQHREVQDCESKLFATYFQSGIKYLDGGVKSGFNHVEKSIKPCLRQVKGKHSVRVQDVDMAWSSFNSGDVFLLDLGQMIYVWNGKDSSRSERFKGLEQARALRDERAKKINIIDVDEGKEDEMTEAEKDLWNQYLPLSEKKIKSKEEGGADEVAEKEAVKGLRLYRCTDEDGTLKISEVKSGPLEKSDLNSGDSYIIQNADKAIWVWIGKTSSKKERSEAMRNAIGFIHKKSLPSSIPVTKVVEMGEPVEFKCLFKKWPKPVSIGKPVRNNRIAKTVQTKFDASTLHSNRAMAAETQMVDDGSGTLEVWRVKDFDLEALDLKKYYGEFYGGDCYVLKYTYKVNGRDHYIIYYWQGLQSTADERGTSALKTIEMDDKLGGAAVQIRVVQNKEPAHFLSIFDGKMVIFQSGHAGWSGGGTDGPGDRYMLQVRGTTKLNTKSMQVPLHCSSLNSNDVFVIFTPKQTFIWYGKGSTGDEREGAKLVSKRSHHDPITVLEGQEKQNFWDAIGGKGEYHSDKRLQTEEEDRPIRLFQISNASGRVVVDEILNYTQDDCVQDDCMMLDAWDTIFIWVGLSAREDEKKAAAELAFEYLKSDPADRDPDTTVCRINQGFEPSTFTGFFGAWDYDYFKKSKSYEQFSKELAAENNEVVVIKEQTANGTGNFDNLDKYKLEDLQKPCEELPGGVDASMREMYLSDEDFREVFKMSYKDFLTKPKWKQTQMKKNVKLF